MIEFPHTLILFSFRVGETFMAGLAEEPYICSTGPVMKYHIMAIRAAILTSRDFRIEMLAENRKGLLFAVLDGTTAELTAEDEAVSCGGPSRAGQQAWSRRVETAPIRDLIGAGAVSV